MDWRRKVDNAHARQKEEEKATLKRREAEQRQREAEERALYQRRLAEHRQTYRCHVCGKPSNGPYIIQPSPPTRGWPYGYGRETVWDHPTGLSNCSICRQYTCPSDLYKGICKTCAQNM